MKIQLITAVAALWSCHVAWAEEPDPDIALEPAHVIINPWRFHIPPTKRQGEFTVGTSRAPETIRC